ncbi:AraC family transcriptional regulator [Paenibacillus alvei]|uniref:AraC family transcriptional regulator n=1 Tax=Paenibacillus alvei TaxID=44250 RepID=A0ABT4GRS4_PAEAL|nr:AraC family transcriptional regulator [Paenibacillus alvei]EJW18772.1 bacterial regulatory helix-turn-helix protein [Paenibacillus alvei DSM 29]MCY7487653.1 AraC family transcriptional regulator [Paenibacillus alvei]MCY9539946.1 AraC family transcriptional regulator [Paenibacillus alvei]MCY9707157.1 AraC family transcriptional regulator [Paenibacillus alvei]MCY9733372.1 AraC family transcriptional regulator [Paenibacillus alvei]
MLRVMLADQDVVERKLAMQMWKREDAHAAGYTTLQYFNRVFKQIVKMTLLEYRKHFGI